MYNSKEQQDKMIKMCMEKDKKKPKKGEKIFYTKCGKTDKKKCKCK
jgi:hypothetical protein